MILLFLYNTNHSYTNTEINLEILHTLPKGWKLNKTEQYEIYKHYKQSQTNILNEQLHYKTHTLSHNPVILALYHWKQDQQVSSGLPSTDDDTHCTDEGHSAGWKLWYFIFFHHVLSTPAMSTDSRQVRVALFPSC